MDKSCLELFTDSIIKDKISDLLDALEALIKKSQESSFHRILYGHGELT